MSRAARAMVLSIIITAAPVVPAAGGVQMWHAATIAALNANQSLNWGGYNQGAIEKGTVFNGITGDWTVPTAKQHVNGQQEYSATWVGIGGGCVDAGCLVGDQTLIQAGTEQDVSKNGTPSWTFSRAEQKFAH